MDGDIDAEDDERSIELSSIAAIFPELEIDPNDPFSASLDLAVSPLKPLPVIFPLLTSNTLAQPLTRSFDTLTLENTNIVVERDGSRQTSAELKYLSHLPPLHMRLALPREYPSQAAPVINLSTEQSWIPDSKLRALEAQAEKLWNDMGHELVLYDYIDGLQQAAETAFDLAPSDGQALNLPATSEVALLDYDLKSKRNKFEEATFDCGVCLEPKKGAMCYKLQECGHVFCVECLQNFYNCCITEGDVYSVKCLAPNCEQKTDGYKGRTATLAASELIQIPIEPEQVQRYVKLLRKKSLEANKNTIYCPRKWCQGPAKSSLSTASVALMESEESKKELPPPNERLCVCYDCSFAFCVVCLSSWHGEHAPCFPRSQSELTAEEMASEAYLRNYSQLCPTCRARCQKTHGCNHMECFQCKTHFCYLCRSFLDKANPYKHFNTPYVACYMRLWELEQGDGVIGPNDRPPDSDDEDDDDEAHEEEAEIVQQGAPHAQGDNQPPPPAPVPPNIPGRPRIRAGLGRERQGQGQGFGGRAFHGNGLQRFLAMAAADEEDGWDSDELDDIDEI